MSFNTSNATRQNIFSLQATISLKRRRFDEKSATKSTIQGTHGEAQHCIGVRGGREGGMPEFAFFCESVPRRLARILEATKTESIYRYSLFIQFIPDSTAALHQHFDE